METWETISSSTRRDNRAREASDHALGGRDTTPQPKEPHIPRPRDRRNALLWRILHYMGTQQCSTKSTIGAGTYSLRDAALLLHLPYGKLRRWAAGYWYSATDEDRFSEPVVPISHDELDERILSFHDLMELAVVAFFRGESVSMSVVRAARARAQVLFKTEYPFATERLQTDGSGIFSDLSPIDDVPVGKLQLELSKGQLAYREFVEPFFRQNVDFAQDGLASAYWPMGRDKPVLLDAGRAFGRPIIRRSGTPTFILYQMRQAGENLDSIAAWYELTPGELDAALEYEQSLRTAA